jgi:flagellar biosynthesis protein FlhA
MAAEQRIGFNLPTFQSGAKAVMGRSDVFFALGIVIIIMVLLVPIPKQVLDFMLTVSITISVLILMTVLFIDKPLNLNSFPTILLIATMLRLALNIASTRLVLSHGHLGTDAAGHVIEAFGSLVMAGSVLIGGIIFAILTIINFVVITKGSGRIAEVSARFSLDAMPGKQMAIDADLSAGLIDEQTAKSRRKELEDESSFYGAMDGASKFVRGDAIAGLLITFINFVGGIIIGTVQKNLSFSQALETYTVLTIGDGLVSQIPALIVSTAAGLLVTKSGASGSAEKAVLAQLGRSPTAVAITSGILCFMALMPGIPTLPFLFLSGVTGYIAYRIIHAPVPAADGGVLLPGQTAPPPGSPAALAAAGTQADGKAPEEPISDALHIDVLRLELGYGLLPLINYQKGHRLTEQIKALRKQMVRDLGFIIPAVRIQDNMQLPPNVYIIKVKEVESGRGEIKPDMLLVMNPSGGKINLPGEDTTEPTFGLPAMWVPESYREEALFKNYTVVDPPTVVTTHLTELVKENMPEMLSYVETQKLVDELPKVQQKLISEVIPSQISISGIQRVLQNLLGEQVSIRDLPTIIEAIAEAARANQSITAITEHVRARLARQISYANTVEDGYIPVAALSPAWEQSFNEALATSSGDDRILSLAPSKIQEFITTVRKRYDQFAMQGEMPIMLTSPAIRPYVRSIVERFRPTTVVLSQNEIHPRCKIKTLGQI